MTELIQLFGHFKEFSLTNIFIKYTVEDWQGFPQKFYLECNDCTWCHGFYSSQNLCFLVKIQNPKHLLKLMLDLWLHFEKMVKEIKQYVHSQQLWICLHHFLTNHAVIWI